MNKTEVLFSAVSFTIALIAGVLLALGFVASAALTAWGGSIATVIAYAVIRRGDRADEAGCAVRARD